jgi:SAM-dependent methyltransferase
MLKVGILRTSTKILRVGVFYVTLEHYVKRKDGKGRINRRTVEAFQPFLLPTIIEARSSASNHCPTTEGDQQNVDRSKYELLIVQLFLDMLEDLGTKIDSHSLILDFGCGEGWVVYQFRTRGLKAFGTDIINRYDNIQKICRDEGIIKPEEDIFSTIDLINYRIPFADNTFDVVISDQVFEHVQNWPEAIAEIKRVLKPGGVSLHFFPSRYRPLEPHVYVPFAEVIQNRAYLAFWAFLGVRSPSQKQLSWKKVVEHNFEYLTTRTNYLRKVKIRKHISVQFGNVTFVEGIFIKHHFGRIRRYLSFFSRKLPFISVLFSTFHTRIIFFKKMEKKV